MSSGKRAKQVRLTQPPAPKPAEPVAAPMLTLEQAEAQLQMWRQREMDALGQAEQAKSMRLRFEGAVDVLRQQRAAQSPAPTADGAQPAAGGKPGGADVPPPAVVPPAGGA